MISDVLSDACFGIDEYLNNNFYDDTYCGELREEIIAVKTIMNAIRTKLDTSPAPGIEELVSEIVEEVKNISSDIQMLKKEIQSKLG